MTTPLEHIVQDFEAYQRSVKACRTFLYLPETWQNAYGALGRLRDRYLHEKNYLTRLQSRALEKVFEADTLIEEMLQIHQLSEDVVRDVRILTLEKFPLEFKTSAHDMFKDRVVWVRDTRTGKLHRFDHLNYFVEAAKRVQRAL